MNTRQLKRVTATPTWCVKSDQNDMVQLIYTNSNMNYEFHDLSIAIYNKAFGLCDDSLKR